MESMAAIQEHETQDDVEDEFDEDVFVVGDNQVLILEDKIPENDNSEIDEEISENQILLDIQNAVIEFDQINFPGEQSTCNNINLPRQMRCFSHLLNLVGTISTKICSLIHDWLNCVQFTYLGKVGFLSELEKHKNSFDSFSSIYNKLKRFWYQFSKSTHVNKIVQDACGCSFKTPCATRWNAEYDALLDAYQKREKVIGLIHYYFSSKLMRFKTLQLTPVLSRLSKEYRTLSALTIVEWNIIADYISLMRPIAQSLDKLQGEKNVSIGSVMPCLYFVESEITKADLKTKFSVNTRIQAIGLDMQTALLATFKCRFKSFMQFSNINRELILAAVSHPIYKTKWINNEMDMALAKSLLEEEAQKVAQINSDVIGHFDELNDIDEDEFLPRQAFPLTRRLSSEDASGVGVEIVRYLEDRDKNTDILNKYPIIQKIYRKFNTTLSSSGPIERIFSQALIIFTPRRNKISDSTFEKSLMLKINKDLY